MKHSSVRTLRSLPPRVLGHHPRERRLLIIGSGDVALRALPWLLQRFRVFALCRSTESADAWRLAGACPVRGDLDDAPGLQRLRGLGGRVLHTAPPATDHAGDARTQRLLARLGSARMIPRALVYISTTGVYGDRSGARVNETNRLQPHNARAKRRVCAERLQRHWVSQRAAQVPHGRPRRALAPFHRPVSAPALAILRAPGIYAAERLPLARLRAGTPALREEEDGYTSHIHADDLAKAAGLALFRGRAGRAFNVCDDSELKMGDWFDRVADAFGLPRPLRITRAEAEQRLPESLLSFMRESRRLDNRRMKEELGLRLRYRTVDEGLAAALERERVLPAVADTGGRGGH